MTTDLSWFQFHWQRWLLSRKVKAMTFAQRGLYLHLLLEQWADGPLPSDHTALAAICGLSPAEFEAIWRGIAPCFEPLPDGTIANPFLEELRAQQTQKFEQARRAGSAGGKRTKPPRSSGTEANAQAGAQAGAQANAQAGAQAVGRLVGRLIKVDRDREVGEAAATPPAWSFANPEHHAAYLALRTAANNPQGLDGIIRAHLQPLGGRVYTPDCVGAALFDFWASNGPVTLSSKALTAFCRREASDAQGGASQSQDVWTLAMARAKANEPAELAAYAREAAKKAAAVPLAVEA